MARNTGINQSVNRRTRIENSEVEYSQEEIVWLKAIEDFKRTERRPFPTCSETLEVLKSLGYRKVAEPMTVQQLRLLAG